jgi:hypothetical protein
MEKAAQYERLFYIVAVEGDVRLYTVANGNGTAQRTPLCEEGDIAAACRAVGIGGRMILHIVSRAAHVLCRGQSLIIANAIQDNKILKPLVKVM